MYIFDDFYNDTYNDFYSTCKNKQLIYESPIPYNINPRMNVLGEYKDNNVLIQSTDISIPSKQISMGSILYHEFTHYYDEQLLKSLNHTPEQIDILMLTYSEKHASYNEMLYRLGFPSLKVNKLFGLNDKISPTLTFAQFCASNVAFFTSQKINPLTFKRCMYFLGSKKAIDIISKDKKATSKAYNYNKIPQVIYSYVMAIENILNSIPLENMNDSIITDININKTKATLILLKYSMQSLPLPDIDDIEDIKNIITNFPL